MDTKTAKFGFLFHCVSLQTAGCGALSRRGIDASQVEASIVTV